MSISITTEQIWCSFKKSVEQLDSEKVRIEVYDKNYPSRKSYLGVFECDFYFVYGKPDHRLSNFWIVLSNPESDNYTRINGYLKLSISILHSDDRRVIF